MLTAKQEKFAQSIADGMTQSDAYRTAYDAQNMKDSSVHVNASKLLSEAKIAQRVTELKAKLDAKALWTREQSVNELIKTLKQADGEEVTSQLMRVRIKALKVLNEMHGYNEPIKIEHSGAITAPMFVMQPVKPRDELESDEQD